MRIILLLTWCSVVASTIAQTTYRYHGEGTSLWDFIQSRSDLSILASWVQEIEGLELAFDTVPQTRPFTFFAPSNEALTEASQNLLYHFDSPLGKRTLLYNIYTHYIHNDAITLDKFNSTYMYLQSASYAYVGIQDVEGKKMLNKVVGVVEGDLMITNGVVHIVDQLLNPTQSHYENDRLIPKYPAWRVPAAGWEFTEF